MRKTVGSTTIPVKFVGSSVFGRFPKINAERTYNMFISDGWLVSFPGYKRAYEFLPEGEGRGLFRSFRANIMVAVVNSIVYRIEPNLVVTQIGTLDTASGEVSIAENLNAQICIVDGLNAYIYNHSLAPQIVKQTVPSDLVPNYVSYHDTFFLIGNGDTTGNGAKWFAYSRATDTTITETTELALQTKPDYALAAVAIPSQANNVLVFGGSVTEVHAQVGGLQNYRRNQSVSIDYGCLSVNTIATNDNIVMWLGVNENNQPAIMLFQGQQAQRISTDGIDFELSRIKFPEQSHAEFLRIDGHLQYVLTFYNQEDNLTLLFDTNTGQFFHLTDENLNHHPMRQVVYFDGKLYFVSYNDGSLYELSTDFTSINYNADFGVDYEDPRLIHEIPRVRICNTIRIPTTAPFRANSFTITLDMGNDNIPAQQDCIILMITEDSVPILTQDNIQVVPEGAGTEDCQSTEYVGAVDLAVSGNGGEVYSNYVRRFTNPRGVRRNIIRWEAMGMYNEWTPKIRFSTLGRVVSGEAAVEVF